MLLMVDYISVKQGVPIPWDAVAKQIEPFLSGEAIKQHMAKLRKYREENGQRVPAKLEKSARRKSKATGDASNTPAKGKQGKKTKYEDDYDSDDDTPSKGRSLLWFAPPKKTKTPKTEKEEAPTTPAQPRAGGRKKAKTAEESGSSFEAKAKSTAKRSRKNQTIKKEEAGESDYESPTKKQKTLRLRAKEEIDYNEQLSDLEDDVLDARQPADNEEDENYEDTQEYPDAIIRHEPSKSRTELSSCEYSDQPLQGSPRILCIARAQTHRRSISPKILSSRTYHHQPMPMAACHSVLLQTQTARSNRTGLVTGSFIHRL